MFTVTSVPNNHPCMSRVEKDYIIDAIGPTIVSEETEDVCLFRKSTIENDFKNGHFVTMATR